MDGSGLRDRLRTAGATVVRPYQRRRTRPLAVLVGLLAVVAFVTWTIVLVNAAGRAGAAACPAPADTAALGTVLDQDALDSAAPAAASTVKVRVVNGGGQRGQANLVAAQLGDLGFTEAATPINDPLYPDGNLDCRGQLRFGASGESAAATLALVLPCTELVRDGREDATVDVAVGTEFADVKPTRPVRDVLDQLANPAVGDGSANAGAPAAAPAQPAVDPTVLTAARTAGC